MATYLPTKNVTPVFTFFQYTSGGGVSGLQTALVAAYTTVTIQVFTDASVSGNALVVVNDLIVFSVPVNNWVGYNQGTWAQYLPAKLAGGVNSLYTAYTP